MVIRNTSKILMLIFLLFALAGNTQPLQKQVNSIPVNFRTSQDEMRLYNMINDYRKKYDLPPIPLSASLCYVASAHVRDLFFHHPDQDPCNFHSWSDKGPWKAFCYPRDENKKNSVWDIPKEITPYKGKGYEIVYWENSEADIDSVFNFWRSVDYFNSFLMNTGKWLGNKWEAIGIGIYENYACAWFGQVPDQLGPPLLVWENPPPAKTGVDSGLKTETLKPAPAVVYPPITSPADTLKKQYKYYIIIRSNVPVADTARLMKLYRDKGYKSVRFFPGEGKGRISVFETADRAEAQARLKEIKIQARDAWMMKN